MLASKAVCRVGGACALWIAQHNFSRKARTVVGTAPHQGRHQRPFLETLDPATTIIALDSKGGRIVVKGWQEATEFTAERSPSLEPTAQLPLPTR